VLLLLRCVFELKFQLDFVQILSQWVAHVSFKFGNSEVQFKLVATPGQVRWKQRIRKTADKTALIILHDLIVVVFEEFELEVGQVKPAVVVCRELICYVQHNFVSISFVYKSVRHGFSDFKNLLVRRNQLVKL